eukprot:2974172-Pyramimonas_sp.AAC.1
MFLLRKSPLTKSGWSRRLRKSLGMSRNDWACLQEISLSRSSTWGLMTLQAAPGGSEGATAERRRALRGPLGAQAGWLVKEEF